MKNNLFFDCVSDNTMNVSQTNWVNPADCITSNCPLQRRDEVADF